MKKLVYILVLFCVACGVACCNRYGETEARLVAIDSLVCDQPDSALSLLADINGDSLPTDLQAYHSLLTVQALYKAYIPATSDTLIRRAWDYYRDHGPYDRRIRAMLYMGTVAEELGHPDSAMRWYKRTELESRPDDHYHRGFSLKQMACLYQEHFIDKSAISKYRYAAEELHHTHDTICYLFCCLQLSHLYRIENQDSVTYYSGIVINLSQQMKDSTYYYAAKNSDIVNDFYLRKYQETIDSLRQIFVDAPNYISVQDWSYLTIAYSKLGNLDSAQYYSEHAPEPESAIDSMLYFQSLSELYKLKGDQSMSGYYLNQSDEISGHEITYGTKPELINEENHIIKEFQNATNQELKLNLLISCIISVIIAFVVFLIVRQKYIKRKKEITALSDLVKQLEKQKSEAEQAKHTDNDVTRRIGLQSYCINELFKGVVYSGKRGASIFKLLFEGESKKESGIISVKVPDDFWPKLGEYVETTYPNAIENMKKEGIELTEKETDIICLDCLQIPNAVIEHILGYGERSLSPIKSKLISKIGKGETDINKILQKYSDK